MSLILKPQLSEKAYAQSEAMNTFVFVVPKSANSQQVANAVASQYGVKIAKVRVASRASKPLRTYRRGRFINSRRPSVKKAYVTLSEGETLPIFAAEKEAEKKAEKAAAKEKK